MLIKHNNIIYDFRENDVLIQHRPYKDGSVKFQPQTYRYLYFAYNDLYGIVYRRETDRLYRTLNLREWQKTINPKERKKNIKEVTHEFDHILETADSYETYWDMRIHGADVVQIPKFVMDQYIFGLFSDEFIKEEGEKRYGVLRKTQSGYVLRYPVKIYDRCVDNKCCLHDAVKYVSENPGEFIDCGKLPFVSEILVGSEKIVFEKTNKNSKGVDFIKVYMPVISKYTEPDNQKIIKIYKKEREDIIKVVIRRIKESKSFVKLGVPINIFRLTNVTLTNQRELYFLFELKEELVKRSDTNQ